MPDNGIDVQANRLRSSTSGECPKLPFHYCLPAAPRHLCSVHLPFRAILSLPIRASAPKHHVNRRAAPDAAANPVQISAHPIRTVDF